MARRGIAYTADVGVRLLQLHQWGGAKSIRVGEIGVKISKKRKINEDCFRNY